MERFISWLVEHPLYSAGLSGLLFMIAISWIWSAVWKRVWRARYDAWMISADREVAAMRDEHRLITTATLHDPWGAKAFAMSGMMDDDADFARLLAWAQQTLARPAIHYKEE